MSQSQQVLSFSVDRLLQHKHPTKNATRGMRGNSSSSSNSSTPPSSPPIIISQTPRVMINGGVTAFPIPLGMPLAASTSTSWTPASSWSLIGLPAAAGASSCTSNKPSCGSPWGSIHHHPLSVGAVLQQAKGMPFSNIKGKRIEVTTTSNNEKEDETDEREYSPDDLTPSGSSILLHAADDSKIARKYRKKKRTTFTSSQLQQLETRFNQQKYLTKLDRCQLAQVLGLTEKHVKTWYQNRRTKWKRECTDEIWSREREHAAANMYTQHLQLKSINTSPSPKYTMVN